MIDLTTRDLPNVINVNGKSIFINTDFRVWLNFWKTKKVNYRDLIKDNTTLLESDREELDNALKRFLNNPNKYPKDEGGSSETLIDYYHDGEYIYSAFMTQYHIDLLEADMHWHKFKALADDLSVGIITHAKKARGYQKPPKKATEHDYWSKEKKAWQIRDSVELTEEEKMKIEEFENYFNTD